MIDLNQLSFFSTGIACLFALTVLIQLGYYLIVFLKFIKFNPRGLDSETDEPVSVIIAAHNEDFNLEKNLPYIFAQDYPNFEVVVINHASTDNTSHVLSDFSRINKNLKIVNIDEDLNFFKGKKFPLSIGIKSASHEILLLTDADCKPKSNQWIKQMVSNYDATTEIILGYGPYNEEDSFLNKIIRYDTFMVALQYFSFAISKFPYMGVGRNLSYRKSLFLKNKGFTSHYGISSGDDDLFIMQASNKVNTKIEINTSSFMYSEPKPTFKSWIIQKQRHLSTGGAYPLLFKILLGVYSISHLFLYITFILLMANNILILPSIILFAIYLIIRFIIQKNALSKLGEDHLLLFSLFGDIIHIVLLSAISFKSLIKKQGDWK
ncbi:MAG: glycosyltransferase [Lentimicrobiaceae bacterium]|jgi:glycosyltransferase involved in cell wall biosynthesis|nr:glycosyltransferase [Lentimicrobiaceae bacterium]MBT3454277.1 glycosyltransferase [Lentimicrobiaceae bacterium]MBT3818951.1 glycosyltransferase [Lentimicrobiaceae bacterium]MBT4060719.1 glycosyltransferase [Lentimicrobiaceae bacterium]MBT4467807.1 glycosyltransferase [Lentimicrobiaceae bacterium]